MPVPRQWHEPAFGFRGVRLDVLLPDFSKRKRLHIFLARQQPHLLEESLLLFLRHQFHVGRWPLPENAAQLNHFSMTPAAFPILPKMSSDLPRAGAVR